MSVNYIASAGTGKTYTLVSEVLDKIKNHNTSINDMLILTFTEKAASELKERIASRIREEISKSGDPVDKQKLHREILHIDNAYIGTFHSVFFRLLKMYPLQSKIDTSYQIISEQLDEYLNLWFEKWIEEDFDDKSIWQSIMQSVSIDYKNLKNAFIILYKNRSKLQRNSFDLSLHKQEEKIKGLFYDLENLVNQRKQDNKINKVKLKSLERFIKTKNLSDLNIKDKYDTELDNILIKLRDEIRDYNANLLLFKFFDFLEFTKKQKQKDKVLDFDDIVEKFLELIKNNEYVKEALKNKFKYIFVDEFQDTDKNQTEILNFLNKCNIYVFGDPKQCIYTWREADLDVYFDFIKNFQSKLLTDNYRSCPKLVEFFNILFSEGNILDHIDQKYRYKVKSAKELEDKSEACCIKFITLKNPQNKSEVKEEARYTVEIIKKLIEEGYEFRDIMILFRKNDALLTFYDILSSYNIPVISHAAQNLFESPEVIALLNILKYIEYPDSKLAKLKVLKSPLFYKRDEEIINSFDLDGDNKNVLESLIRNKHSLTVDQIIEELLNKTDFLETLALDENGKQKIENIKKVNLLAKQKAIEGLSLREFLYFAENYEENVPIVEDENAVKLMTIHKSKGLESKVVIIPLISLEPREVRLNNIHIYNGQPLINLFSSRAVSKEIKSKEKDLKEKIINENKRLFYVATTRAKEKLIFIQWKEKENAASFKTYIDPLKDKIKSLIQEEEIDLSKIKVEPYQIQEEPENLQQLLKEIEDKERKRDNLYKEAIEKSRFTSVSQIMKEDFEEKDIQQKFLEAKEENIGIYIGVLVHEVLEKVELKEYSFEKAKEVLNILKNTIPELYRNKVIEQAEELLKKFENSDIYKEIKKSEILYKELPFTIYEDDRFIEGRIDLVYEKDNEIVVMDYKTNKYETEEEKKKILETYGKQKEYYLKAVEKIFPERKIVFKLGLLWKGELL